MAADVVQDDDGPQHLKQVSRIKHIILQKYLPSWEPDSSLTDSAQ
jgi:hypothetical protein